MATGKRTYRPTAAQVRQQLADSESDTSSRSSSQTYPDTQDFRKNNRYWRSWVFGGCPQWGPWSGGLGRPPEAERLSLHRPK